MTIERAELMTTAAEWMQGRGWTAKLAKRREGVCPERNRMGQSLLHLTGPAEVGG